MNKFERFINKGLNTAGIYPHDGKNVVYIRDGELNQGVVIGSGALTGHTPLSQVDSVELMNIRNEVAAARKERPAVTARRLYRGEMVIYREPEKQDR